jgi:G:T-mismatch repair DNA endonuclease (very short patch repair protein)
MAKLTANVDRDRRDAESLKALGWSVFTIWECQTRDAEQLDQLFWRIVGSGEGGLDGFDRKVQGFAP